MTANNNTTPWLHYKRPFVRDLAYAIVCPTVITHWVNHRPLHHSPNVSVHSRDFWQQQFENYTPRLAKLDEADCELSDWQNSDWQNSDYEELSQFLLNRPSPHRLGFHFEGLIHFWLLDGFTHGCHHFEVLAHNVQLYRDKQTVGELDFILRNHTTGDIEHWELAIKFFVGSPPYDYANWVGLNSRDNLKLKMTHMQTRQFNTVWVDVEVTSENASSQNNIQQDNADDKPVYTVRVDKRIGVIKGRFFKPITDSDFVRPEWLTADFPLHDWVDGTDLSQLNLLDMRHLREAEYVEWFTKRLPSALEDGDNRNSYHDDTPLTLAKPLKTGLYFYNDTPVVIYHPNRNRQGDKF